MGKYFDLSNIKKPPPPEKKTIAQSRTLLSVAQQMHEKFPQLAITECFEMVVAEWNSRRQARKDAMIRKTQREIASVTKKVIDV